MHYLNYSGGKGAKELIPNGTNAKITHFKLIIMSPAWPFTILEDQSFFLTREQSREGDWHAEEEGCGHNFFHL